MSAASSPSSDATNSTENPHHPGSAIRKRLRAVKITLRRLEAHWIEYSYYLLHRVIDLARKRGPLLYAVPLAALPVLILIVAPRLQQLVGGFFEKSQRLEALRTLFVTLGGALVGATAIGFSIVIFAMQTNFERLPYVVFRKLSADLKLLSAFFATFLLALGVAAASLIADERRIAIDLAGVCWATIVILFLVLYAYARALALINPYEQINSIVQRALKDITSWDRRANRAQYLVVSRDTDQSAIKAPDPNDPEPDVPRAVFFRDMPHWTALSRQTITHLVSFSRRYAQRADHEVAAAALTGLIALNNKYVAVKGRTFFSQPFDFDNPLATDTFINEVLEALRQSMRIALASGDEVQMEQTLTTIAGLV